ncbi:MAG: protein kinase, partial [Myxococcales bacterium]|nr:protein kinase [Myxococcales bacterium]
MSEAPAPKKRTDKLVGQLLAGKYKILKKIGEGGMGSVYIATQEPIDRKVAVKVLLGKLAEDEIAVKRFEQEARAISKMQHPNTVTIYDFGRTSEDEDDRLYIVMEYLKGQTLTQVLRKDKVLAPARACKVVRQVCASLADAHATGIIHRDLKPDNIFLTEVGGDKDWVKVLDFGVAKLADSEGAGTLTQTGMIFGTPKYMSPEQAEGRPIDYRADIYALGVVLYELLVGRPPFIADTPVGLLLKHISEPPPPFSKVRPDLQIDPRLEAITMRALDKRPDARQQMVAELAAELEAFERIATGQVPAMFASGTYPAPVQGGLPTEVVPGTLPGSPVTPAGLHPPGAVPSNLSLGSVSGGTEAVGPHHPHPSGATAYGGASAQYRPADAMPTAAQGAMPAASVQMTAQGLTHPVAAHGGYAETLGGISGEISGPFPGGSAKAQKRSPLMFVGVGLLAAGVVLAGVVFATSQKPTVESVPTPPAADPGKVAALKTPE